MTLEELRVNFYKAIGRGCCGNKTDVEAENFADSIVQMFDGVRTVIIESVDGIITPVTWNDVMKRYREGQNIQINIYEGQALKHRLRMYSLVSNTNGVPYVLGLELPYGTKKYDYTPYLATYVYDSNKSTFTKLSSRPLNLTQDISSYFDIYSNLPETQEWIDNFENLVLKIKEGNFFLIHEGDNNYPVQAFYKVSSEDHLEQIDLYAYRDPLRYEHLRFTRDTTSSTLSWKGVLRETKETAKAATLETITDASEITVTCESGRIRQGNNIMTLAIGCSASDNSQAVEERIVFSTGSSVESITVTGVSWANGDTPSFKANKVYEINISYIPLLGKFLATYAEY